MKISKNLVFITLFFFSISCQKENIPPTCDIISPSNGTEYDVGDEITISVEAEDEDGSISEVRFYINDIVVSSASSFPYNYDWNTSDEDEGIMKIKVTAKDDQGATAKDQISILLNPGGETVVVEVTNPVTGKTWMDRNLGASQAATSSTDSDAYGDLYQWGRGTDLHEKRTSGTTSTLSNSDTPGHGNFITSSSSSNYDWRSPQNDNLWQGLRGTNNPCPSGYRLPTEAEWEAERQSWGSNNAAGAFASPLKLPMAGWRSGSNGSLGSVGSFGYYWSSTVDGASSRFLFFSSNGASMFSDDRAYGYPVRCIKD